MAQVTVSNHIHNGQLDDACDDSTGSHEIGLYEKHSVMIFNWVFKLERWHLAPKVAVACAPLVIVACNHDNAVVHTIIHVADMVFSPDHLDRLNVVTCAMCNRVQEKALQP